eukprot:tig00000555_g2136.t1
MRAKDVIIENLRDELRESRERIQDLWDFQNETEARLRTAQGDLEMLQLHTAAAGRGPLPSERAEAAEARAATLEAELQETRRALSELRGELGTSQDLLKHRDSEVSDTALELLSSQREAFACRRERFALIVAESLARELEQQRADLQAARAEATALRTSSFASAAAAAAAAASAAAATAPGPEPGAAWTEPGAAAAWAEPGGGWLGPAHRRSSCASCGALAGALPAPGEELTRLKARATPPLRLRPACRTERECRAEAEREASAELDVALADARRISQEARPLQRVDELAGGSSGPPAPTASPGVDEGRRPSRPASEDEGQFRRKARPARPAPPAPPCPSAPPPPTVARAQTRLLLARLEALGEQHAVARRSLRNARRRLAELTERGAAGRRPRAPPRRPWPSSRPAPCPPARLPRPARHRSEPRRPAACHLRGIEAALREAGAAAEALDAQAAPLLAARAAALGLDVMERAQSPGAPRETGGYDREAAAGGPPPLQPQLPPEEEAALAEAAAAVAPASGPDAERDAEGAEPPRAVAGAAALRLPEGTVCTPRAPASSEA